MDTTVSNPGSVTAQPRTTQAQPSAALSNCRSSRTGNEPRWNSIAALEALPAIQKQMIRLGP